MIIINKIIIFYPLIHCMHLYLFKLEAKYTCKLINALIIHVHVCVHVCVSLSDLLQKKYMHFPGELHSLKAS